MEYLFFDIECANCNDGKGKICSFGYCLADEALNIIEKKDILVNPNAPFCLNGGYSNKKYIDLAYPEEEFLRAPKFNETYDTIRALMCADGRVCVGHAVDNDVNFILCECERYSKKIFEYVYYDMQEIYREENGQETCKALTAIMDELNIEELCAHRSDDDAEMTLKVAKALCVKSGCSLAELFKKYDNCRGNVDDIIRRKELKRQCAAFNDFAYNCRRNGKKDNTFKRVNFAFSKRIEKENYGMMCRYVQIIVNKGGRYTGRVSSADIFVRAEAKCERCKKAEEGGKAKIISLQEFFELLGIDEKRLVPFKL